MEEKELVKGCKAGDEKCRRFLYERYAPVLMGICLRYAKNEVEAEDLLHDAFLKIFTKLDSYRGEGSFEGWMKHIAVNTAINAYRKNKEERFAVDLEEIEGITPDVTISDSDPLTVKLLLQFIEELPPGYRTAFNLYEIDGYSHKEVAAMVGCSEVTARSQLYKAKCALKQKIEQHLKNKAEILK